jgi:hypothetical protein
MHPHRHTVPLPWWSPSLNYRSIAITKGLLKPPPPPSAWKPRPFPSCTCKNFKDAHTHTLRPPDFWQFSNRWTNEAYKQSIFVCLFYGGEGEVPIRACILCLNWIFNVFMLKNNLTLSFITPFPMKNKNQELKDISQQSNRSNTSLCLLPSHTNIHSLEHTPKWPRTLTLWVSFFWSETQSASKWQSLSF